MMKKKMAKGTNSSQSTNRQSASSAKMQAIRKAKYGKSGK